MYGGDQFPGLSEDFPRCRVVKQELAEDLLILKDGQDVDLDGGGAGNHNDIYHHVGPDVIGCGTSCDDMDNVLGFAAVNVTGADTTVTALSRLGTADGVAIVVTG